MDEESERFFDSIFNLCVDFFRFVLFFLIFFIHFKTLRKSCHTFPLYSRTEEKKVPQVQMVQYSPLNNQPVTTLKSLRDITPNHFVDGGSLRSHSPAGSFYNNESSPLPTMRPQPPPYPRSVAI